MATRLGNQGVAAQPVPKTVYAQSIEKPKTQKTELYFKGGTPKDWEKFDEGVIKGFVKPGNVKKTIPNFKDTDKGTMKGSMIIKHKGAYELDSEFVKKELGDKVKVYSRVL
jgi:hypothetical protein